MSITNIIVFKTLMVQPKHAMPLLKDTLALYTEQGVTDVNLLRVSLWEHRFITETRPEPVPLPLPPFRKPWILMWLKVLSSRNSALCELTQERVFANQSVWCAQKWPNDMRDTRSIGSPAFEEWL